MANENNYPQSAAQAYQRIVDFFQGRVNDQKGNYWQLGCAFDTMLDYMQQQKISNPAFINNAYTLYSTLVKTNSACWYDDHAWWGIAATKAMTPAYQAVFGNRAGDFATVATDCWHNMNYGKPTAPRQQGAPNVWANRCNGDQDKNYFSNPADPLHWTVPRFENGVWQYDIFHDKRQDECSYYNPSDPTVSPLGGFQNTVVNALYWVFALRLFSAGVDTRQAVTNEHDFLFNWFFLQLPNKQPDTENALLNRFSYIGLQAALVRERVSTYAALNGTYPSVNAYYADDAWGGDQGLIVGALVDYYTRTSDQTSLEVAQMILNGIAGKLTVNNVLQSTTLNWQGGDPDDYSSGIGVCQRYLLYAWRNNSSIRNEILRASYYQTILRASADAVCNQSPSTNPLFDDFNCLATLTTAMEVLA